jgi:hypothetical protein
MFLSESEMHNYYIENAKIINRNNLDKSMLSEGLFGNPLQEIRYMDAIKEWQTFNKKFIDTIKKYPSLKTVATYKDNIPTMFCMGKKDFRCTLGGLASDFFLIRDLARDTGTTENLVVQDINSLLNTLSLTNRYINLTIVRDSNYNYAFYYYMDQKKCFTDLIAQSKPKLKVPVTDIITEMKTKRESILTQIKKHPLKIGDPIHLDKNFTDAKIYRYRATSGSGICMPIQEGTDSFAKKDFSKFQPDITIFSVTMHLSYFLDETMLENTNIELSAFGGGSSGTSTLYLISRPNIFVQM